MKKNCTSILAFTIAFLCTGFYFSSDPFISKLKKQLEKYTIEFPQEKIYVHTDRSAYVAGEDVWFKVYLRDASTMLPTEISTVAYVELINEDKKVLFKKNIFIVDGSGIGDFQLPLDLTTRDYTLRAYTSFMRNFEEEFFFKKNINIIGKEPQETKKLELEKVDEIVANFFPEGGDLVNGIPSRVGFKIIDRSSGNGIPASGRIINEKEETVAFFKTVKFGLGIINFTPQKDQQYIAEIEFRSRIYKFPLPEVLSQGYVMQVSNRDEANLSIQLSTNIKNGIKDLYLVGQMRGSLFYAGKLDSESSTAKMSISKDSLPDGIAQLTIFSGNGEPLCERLVFVERTENAHHVKISTPKKTYSPREKVAMEIAIQDVQEQNIQADLSLTVTNADLFAHSSNAENIKSWMLLNSDLKGKIEQPGFYFSDQKNSTKYLLDILMMTQGWRRFTWKQLKEDEFPKIEHLPEIGFNIKGYVTKEESEKRRVSNIFLSVMDEQFQFQELETDASGNFFFSNVHFFDTTTVVLQARKPHNNHEKQKKKKKNEGKLLGSKLLDIHIEKEKPVAIGMLANSSNNIFTDEQVEQYLNEYERILEEKEKFDGWDIELTDVVVKARKLRKNMTAMEKLDNSAKVLLERIVLDSVEKVPASVLQLLRNLPGIRVTGAPFQEEIGRPIFLDDVAVPISVIHNLSPQVVHFIDVYDNLPLQFGVDGAGVVIYTRMYTGEASIKRDGIVHLDRLGYYKAREFYSPDHNDKTQDPNLPDYRTTLFWQPDIRTTETNNNEITFFTCDQTGTYDVIVEGMTKRGIPVFGKYQISVE